MTTRNQKLNEKTKVDPETLGQTFIAVQKLIENHKEEHAFYIEYVKTHPVKDWQDIPDSPIELTTFCMKEYLKAALAQVEYEKDEDMIVASVPNASGFYSQGESYEEARTNLLDAIEGNVQIALQMGWDIPRFPGVDVRTSVVSSDPA